MILHGFFSDSLRILSWFFQKVIIIKSSEQHRENSWFPCVRAFLQTFSVHFLMHGDKYTIVLPLCKFACKNDQALSFQRLAETTNYLEFLWNSPQIQNASTKLSHFVNLAFRIILYFTWIYILNNFVLCTYHIFAFCLICT